MGLMHVPHISTSVISNLGIVGVLITRYSPQQQDIHRSAALEGRYSPNLVSYFIIRVNTARKDIVVLTRNSVTTSSMWSQAMQKGSPRARKIVMF